MEEELAEAAAPAPVARGEDDGDKPAAPPEDFDSDSSDSDGGGDGGDAADELRIQALERALQDQPLDYESHVQYIQCLRKSGKIEKLRAAREEMNKYFPLTPKMWQDWAKDEVSLSTGHESFGEIEKLYKRGVQDYLSVKLWRDYLDYVEEHDQSVAQCSPSGLSKMRDLFLLSSKMFTAEPRGTIHGLVIYGSDTCCLWSVFMHLKRNCDLSLSKLSNVLFQV